MQDAALPESPCAHKPICTADAPDEALWPRSCLFLALNSLPSPAPPTPPFCGPGIWFSPSGSPGGLAKAHVPGDLPGQIKSQTLAWQAGSTPCSGHFSTPRRSPQATPVAGRPSSDPSLHGPSPGESQPSEGGAEHRVGLSKIHVAMQACHYCHWWDRLCIQVFSTKLCFHSGHTSALRLPCPRLASAPSSPLGGPRLAASFLRRSG